MKIFSPYLQLAAVKNTRNGAPGRNRTCGQQIRNLLLYPLSYGGIVPMRMTFHVTAPQIS